MSNLSLNGEYKFIVYDAQKNIKQESDYFSNFITSHGLESVYYTGFAHNLKYLSLGSSNAVNTLQITGLAAPIEEEDFFYVSGFILNSAGTQINASGLNFYKSWLLPTGESGFQKDYKIREFMVSPESPYTEEYTNKEGAPLNPEDDPALKFDLTPNYFSRAFSRATGFVNLETGDFLNVSYRLKIGINTGIKYFNTGKILTGSANTNDKTYLSFNNFSGIYSFTHPALEFMLPVEGIKESNAEKIGKVEELDYLGKGMEPSCNKDSLFCYLSSNGTQFLSIPTGKGGPSITTGDYDLSSGIHKYVFNAPLIEGSIKKDIRRKDAAGPSTGDLFQIESDPSENFYLNSSLAIPAGGLSIGGTGRMRSLVRSFGWIGVSESPIDLLVSNEWQSMVLGYKKPPEGPGEKIDASKGVIPYADFLFGTSSGELKPKQYTYYNKSNEIKTGYLPNSGSYLKLNTDNNLTLNFKLSWSSPCGDCEKCS